MLTKETVGESPYPVIEITSEGEVHILHRAGAGPIGKHPIEPGLYQWRPIGRRWEADAESGSDVPVWGWAVGIFSREELPTLCTLPKRRRR